MTTATTTDKMTALFAKIGVEVFFGRIMLNPHQSEPKYLLPARMILTQVKNILGEKALDDFAEEMRTAAHVMGDIVFDEAVGRPSRPETVEKLKKLPTELRTSIEVAVERMTGKLDTPNERPGRMYQPLWDLKKRIRLACAMSISNITPEEIREGFDSLMHQVIDGIYDRRETLIN